MTIPELENEARYRDEVDYRLDAILEMLKPAPTAPVSERNSEGYGYLAAAVVVVAALFTGHDDLVIPVLTAAGLYGVGRTVQKTAAVVADGKTKNNGGSDIKLDVSSLMTGMLNIEGVTMREVERGVKNVVKTIRGTP